MACDISTTQREKSLPADVLNAYHSLYGFAAPVTAPIPGTTVMPPFRRISRRIARSKVHFLQRMYGEAGSSSGTVLLSAQT